MFSWAVDFQISVDGVSVIQSLSKFGREARCAHAASDNEDQIVSRLKHVFSRWTTSENTGWIGAERGKRCLNSSSSKYVVGRRENVLTSAGSVVRFVSFSPRKITETR